ncbi:MAG: helix-hairpin-helix domain-containing protein [Eubacteriales bacterium]|nr:helix-hairpin-helix domain-containing protein [Eubacteriales bacterium]
MKNKNHSENSSKKRKKRQLLALCAVLLSAGLTGCGREGEEFTALEEAARKETEEPETIAASPTPGEEPSLVYVDVCGAVRSPGVYALEAGSRVYQAIEAAGGYLQEAAQAYVNRARSLEDGQQIYVPTKGELEKGDVPCDEASLPSQKAGLQEAEGRINLNTAGESELTTLTGIGAAKARAIIAYREAHGPFLAVEDIMNVEGIKEGTFSKIKDEIMAE